VVDFLINAVVNPAGAIAGGRAVERSLGRINARADALRTSLARTFAFIGVGAGVRALVNYADTLTNVQNRLKLVTNSQQELTERTSDLFGIANRTRSSFESTATLYNRVALSARELGKSQEELLQFTESLNQAIILSGVSATEARNGLIQLSQGIASGALRGDELRSVLEQLPAVADVIAERLGVTRGELRLMGAEGLITADIILDAFKDAREELEDRFALTVPTVSQSFEILKNKVIEFVGAVDQSGGVSQKLSQAILFIADNAETLLRSFGALASFMVADFALGAVFKVINALRVLSVALLTNPIFLIGTLIAGSVAALVGFGDQIKLTTDGVANFRDLAVAAFEAVSQVVVPVLDAITAAIAETFGGQLPTLREFAEAFALTFDQIIGAVRGTVNIIRDIFASQLGTALDGVVFLAQAFGLRFKQVFEETANFLTNIFLDPVNTILRALQTLLSSLAGSAAVLAQVGLIAEESRIGVEDSLATIEHTLARLQNREPVVLFNTDETKKQIGDLQQEAVKSFSTVGTNLKESFLLGFERETILGFVKSVFDDAEQIGRERVAKQAADKETAAQPFGGSGGIFGAEERTVLSPNAQQLLDQIDAQQNLNEQALIFNEVLVARKDLSDELETAFLSAQIAALEASTAVEDGFTRAFLKITQEARNFAAVAEQSVNIFTDGATNAITDFLTTGEDRWKEFGESILNELTRILVRLLLVQAISAAVGLVGGGGGGITNAAANAGSQVATSQLQGRASGGTVQPERSFIVGEEGPELFVPNRTGTIVPNAASVQSEPPQVNVQVVNVDDENAVPSAIEGGTSDEAILNVLARNKSRVSQVIR